MDSVVLRRMSREEVVELDEKELWQTAKKLEGQVKDDEVLMR